MQRQRSGANKRHRAEEEKLHIGKRVLVGMRQEWVLMVVGNDWMCSPIFATDQRMPEGKSTVTLVGRN